MQIWWYNEIWFCSCETTTHMKKSKKKKKASVIFYLFFTKVRLLTLYEGLGGKITVQHFKKKVSSWGFIIYSSYEPTYFFVTALSPFPFIRVFCVSFNLQICFWCKCIMQRYRNRVLRLQGLSLLASSYLIN